MSTNPYAFALAALAGCGLIGCQAVQPTDAAARKTAACKSVSLAYLRDSAVVLNSKTVDIEEITSNSVYGSGYDPEYAFDGMPAGNWTQWISSHDFRPFTRASVIQVRYAVPRQAIGYTLLGRYESLKDRLPKDWILQGSNDASGSASDPLTSTRWTTLDSASGMGIGVQWNSPTSYAGITRAISCPASYLRYRLCVTAVNGSSVVDLIEIELLARPDGQLLFPRDSARNPPVFPICEPKDTVVEDTTPVVPPPPPPAIVYTSIVGDTVYTTNSVYSENYAPGNAFDHMPPGNWTQWISDDDFRPFKRASVIQVHYPVAKRFDGYALLGRYETLKDRLPKDWVLQGSSDVQASVLDSTNSSRWTTLDAAVGMSIGAQWNSNTSSARLARTIANPGFYTKYRLCVTAVNGSSVVDLIEIEMTNSLDTFIRDTVVPPVEDSTIPVGMIYTTVGQPGSGIAKFTTNSIYSSEYMPGNAFDHMPPGNWTQWISNHDFRPFSRPAIIEVDYLAAKTIGSYVLVGRYESLKDRLPKDWVLQGSNDARATVLDSIASPRWTTLDATSGAVLGGEWNSTTSSARLSRVIAHPGSYTKYRLCVTAVNGSSVVDLIEIELNP